jgi:hypothetical protein
MGENLIGMLTCKEICRSIASEEMSAAGWRRRWAVKFHLLMCRHCRRYSRQIESIGTAARGFFGTEHSESGSRERLRNSILDRIPHNERDGSDPPV